MKLTLSRQILEITTNKNIEHGFLYGSIKINDQNTDEDKDEKLYNVSLNEINDEDIEIDDSFNKKENYYYKKNCSVFSRVIPLAGIMRLRVTKNEKCLSIDYGKKYRKYSEFILFQRELPERIASIFTYWGLLEKNIISLHCSAAHKNGRTILIFAPPDTGKTQTVMNLVVKKGWKFISDDIVLSNGAYAYAVPYTRSGVWEWDKQRIRNREHPFSKRTRKSRVFDFLNEKLDGKINDQIQFTSKITDIFIIEKGRDELVKLNKSDAINDLYTMNALEFHNIGTRHFWYTASLTKMFNMYDLKTCELKLVDNLVGNSNEVIRLRCDDPNDFYLKIDSIVQGES